MAASCAVSYLLPGGVGLLRRVALEALAVLVHALVAQLAAERQVVDAEALPSNTLPNLLTNGNTNFTMVSLANILPTMVVNMSILRFMSFSRCMVFALCSHLVVLLPLVVSSSVTTVS